MGIANAANLITNPSAIAGHFLPPPKLIGDIPIDVLESENPVYGYRTTEHTIETGARITDHREEEPLLLTLQCIFTDTELSASSIVSGLVSGGGLDLSTWQDKKDALYELKGKGDPITVVTPLDTYTNMLIEKINVSVNGPQQGGSFNFQITFKKATFVSSQFVAINPSDLPVDIRELETDASKDADKRKKPPQNKGQVGPENASADNKSVLTNLLSGLGL